MGIIWILWLSSHLQFVDFYILLFEWLLIAVLMTCSSELGYIISKTQFKNKLKHYNTFRRNDGHEKPFQKSDHNYIKFDFFVFSQTWPLTVCYVWEKKSLANEREFSRNDEWSIHELWPTIKKSVKPDFCNRTARSDLSAIDSLKQQMLTKWSDIHEGSKPQKLWIKG